MSRFKNLSWKNWAVIFSLFLLTACGSKKIDTVNEAGTARFTYHEEKPEAAKLEPNNTPNRILTTFYGDSKTEMGFNWYTTDEFEDAKVIVSRERDLSSSMEFTAEADEAENLYGERTKEGWFIFEDEEKGYYTDEHISPDNKEWVSGGAVGKIEHIEAAEYSYKAVANNLEPDTVYYYKVGSEEGGFSETGTFKTSADRGINEPFTFVQYTDTQTAYWNEHVHNEAAFGADTLEKALETAGEVEFVIHTGDLVESWEMEDAWMDLFEQSQASLLKQPAAVAIGNHDEDLLNYGQNPFSDSGVEDDDPYYSFDYNNAHFLVLNTNDHDNPEEKAMGDDQLKWLEEDIQKARDNGAEWIILNFHKSLFSKSRHSLEDKEMREVRAEFMELIDELDVDLALQGHDHVLSRTEPLTFVPSEENFSNGEVSETEIVRENGTEYYVTPQGTIFVLPGHAGTKAYDDIYRKNIDHIHAVRPQLDWLTEKQVGYWNTLYAFGHQPQKAPEFEESYSNDRDSTIQNFAIYTIHGNKLKAEIYQIEGNLLNGEERRTELVHEFGIIK